MKKVLFIIPSMRGGGAERVLLNLINGLNKEKYVITIAVTEFTGELWDNIPDYVRKINLKVPKLIRQVGKLAYRRFGITKLFDFYASQLRHRYDFVFSFIDSPYTEIISRLNLKPKKKFIVVHSSYKSYKMRNSLITPSQHGRMLDRYNKADCIICVSKQAKLEFTELFKTETMVRAIYNPMNVLDIKRRALDSQGTPSEQIFTFIAIGSLIEVKNFSALIKATYLLKNNTSTEFRVVILGKGPLESHLNDEIMELGLSKIVRLKGFSHNPYTYLRMSDVIVITSLSEGLPTVMCEAMILGKPIIAPRISGCTEVSENGTYSVQYDGTVGNLAKEMNLMLDNPNRVQKYSALSLERSLIFDDTIAIQSYEELMS